MKHFSRDIVNQVKDLNSQIKTAQYKPEEDVIKKQAQLSFLVSELPEEDKEEVENMNAENELLVGNME